MTFDITIPVLNEEETLKKNVLILYEFLKDNFPDQNQWKIVIADNGSTDKTLEIAQKLDQKIDEITYVKVPKRGVGLALKTSWGQSEADIVGYMDLDLATDLSHFLEVYDCIEKLDYDLVYASRLHPDSQVIGRTLKREIASRGFNFLLKAYLNVGFSDGMCGFKFLKRAVFPRLFELGARNDGWFFSTELLTTAEWEGLKIFELPVKWTDDISSSRVKVIPLAKKYIQSMIELKKRKK
ncbi:MAG: glycosyltransferase [Bacteroidetes bacterium]|jgi:glycosyltransferase involved in cell wall biosynthesis|nr:glycosyltransferase [Bacteroidota bacterium]